MSKKNQAKLLMLTGAAIAMGGFYNRAIDSVLNSRSGAFYLTVPKRRKGKKK